MTLCFWRILNDVGQALSLGCTQGRAISSLTVQLVSPAEWKRFSSVGGEVFRNLTDSAALQSASLSPVEGFKEPDLNPGRSVQSLRGDCLSAAEGFNSFRVCEFLLPAHSFFRKYLIQLIWNDFHVSGIPETWMLRGITAKKTRHCGRGPNSINSLPNSRSTSVNGIMRSSLCSTRPVA